MAQIDHSQFIKLLTKQFPDVAADIDDCSEGVLHLEIATLARATQVAIDRQDKSTVIQHFQFIDKVFKDATPDVQNAVYVSYLEHLCFEGRKAASTQARELLTPRLQEALDHLEKYLEELFRRGEELKKPKPSP